MSVRTIVLICAAGVFAFFLFMYILIAFETSQAEKKQRNSLEKSYSDSNLAKMEYDLAVYDEETKRLLNRTSEDSQMTIDELIDGNTPHEAESSFFTKIEGEGVEEITGNFKP